MTRQPWRPAAGSATWVWVAGDWRPAVVEAVADRSVRARYALPGGRGTGVTEVTPGSVWPAPRTYRHPQLDPDTSG